MAMATAAIIAQISGLRLFPIKLNTGTKVKVQESAIEKVTAKSNGFSCFAGGIMMAINMAYKAMPMADCNDCGKRLVR